jgi:hypothetical protein
MINGAMSDANDPGLSVGKSFKEPIGCRYDGFIDFKRSGLNVDRNNFTLITRFDLLANARFIEFLPTSG